MLALLVAISTSVLSPVFSLSCTPPSNQHVSVFVFSCLKKHFPYHTLWDITFSLDSSQPKFLNLSSCGIFFLQTCMPQSLVILLHGCSFCKKQRWYLFLNLIAYIFFTSSLLLLFVAHDKFVTMFICIFTYLMLVPSIKSKFNDDRNVICFVHYYITSVSCRAWTGVDPRIFELSV